MDKKMLRQIPRPETKPEYIELAKNTQTSAWMLHVSEADGLMQVTAWDAAELRNGGNAQAKFRFFLWEDDYITQDLRVEKTKWLTGKVSSTLSIGYWNNKWSGTIFVDTQSRELFEKRFPPMARSWWGTTEKNPFVTIDDWQDKILARRLSDRHERELAHTNLMMELVPDLPEDFETWIHDYGMRSRRYLIYDGNSKIRIRQAFCTECGQHMEIDSREVRLRMNEWGECPCCGSPVVMKTIKRWHTQELATNHVAIVQKLEDGKLLFRCFGVDYLFHKEEFPLLTISKRQGIYEIYRIFMDGRHWESFEYAEYKQSHKERWCPDTGKIGIEEFIIRRDGLRELLAGTPYQYSGLEALQEKEEFREIEIFRYLRAYEKCHDLEMLVKAGLSRLAVENIHNILYWHEKNPIRDLKMLTKPHLRMLREMNGGNSMVSLFREIELTRKEITIPDLKEFIEAFGTSQTVLRAIYNNNLSVRKFSRYAMKQAGRWKKDASARANFFHDWMDYTGWCEELGYDMNDPYVLMPPDFKKAHNRVHKELQDRRDAELRKSMEQLDIIIREQMVLLSDQDPMHLETKKYLIRLPGSVDELREEGKTLHHCVATYANKVAEGKTTILFVRRVETPDIPFFTMEWRDNKVIQCRGSHNCDMPNDVRAFVKAFERKMHEAMAKDTKRLEVRAS